jgi:hypothetical protein
MDPEQILSNKLANEQTAFKRDQIKKAIRDLNYWKDGRSNFPPDLSRWGIDRQAVLVLRGVSKDPEKDTSVEPQTVKINESAFQTVGSGGQDKNELFAHERLEQYLNDVSGDLSIESDQNLEARIRTFEGLSSERWYQHLSKQDEESVKQILEKLINERTRRANHQNHNVESHSPEDLVQEQLAAMSQGKVEAQGQESTERIGYLENEIQQSNDQILAHTKITQYLETVAGDLTAKPDQFILERGETIRKLERTDWFGSLSENDIESFHTAVEKLNMAKRQRINQLLGEAEEAVKSIEQEKVYRKVLLLDPENQTALTALKKQQSEAESQKSSAKIDNFRKRLDGTKQILDLQKVIDELTIARSEGKLPDELENPLFDAEQRLELLKAKNGIVSSHIHFGSLIEKYKAITELENSGLVTFYDQITGTHEAISEALKKAREAWKDESRTAMNKIIGHAMAYMPGNPILSLGYLRAGLGEPDENNDKQKIYHDDQRHLYEQEYSSIENSAKNQEEAENLINRALNEFDPFEKYKLFKSAINKFKYLEGLSDQIQDNLDKARESLFGKVDVLLQQAREAVAVRDFSPTNGAQFFIQKSYSKIEEWPGEGDDLKNKRQEIDKLRDEINKTTEIFKELESREREIIQLTKNQNTINQTFHLFDQIKSDQRFVTDFPDVIARIGFSVDMLKSADEQIEILIKKTEEQAQPDWISIKKLCEKILMSVGEGSAQFKKVQEYLTQAEAELLIQKITDQVDKENIKEARRFIDQLKKDYSGFVGRIVSKEKIVTQAESASHSFIQLFAIARKEETSKQIKTRDHALEIYRFIAGYQSSISTEKDTPPYQLNEFSYEAKNSAKEMEDLIRKDFDLLRSAHDRNENIDMKDLATRARSLMKLRLSYQSEETRLCEWAEVAYTDSIASANASKGEYAKNLELWQELKTRYPQVSETREKETVILRIIHTAAKLIENRQMDMAVKELTSHRDEFITSDLRYKLALSEAYENVGQLDDAFNIINFTSVNEEINSRKNDLSISIAIRRIEDLVLPHRNLFEEAFNALVNDTRETDTFVQKLSIEANEVRVIFTNAVANNQDLKANNRFIDAEKCEKEKINEQLTTVIRKLWENNHGSTDLHALLLSLIKHELITDQPITLDNLHDYLFEENENRILAAIRGSSVIMQDEISSIKFDNQKITSALQQVELLFWQQAKIEKLVTTVKVGISINQLQLAGQTVAQCKYSLRQALKSHTVLEGNDIWRFATQQVTELPVQEQLVNIENIPFVSETLDAREDIRKFLEWRIVKEYFVEVMGNLVKNVNQEKWEEIIGLIKSARYYDQTVTNEMPKMKSTVEKLGEKLDFKFEMIRQNDYSNYFTWFSDNIWINHFQNDVKGWEGLEQYATKCLENLHSWEQWGSILTTDINDCFHLSFLITSSDQKMPWKIPDDSKLTINKLPKYVSNLIENCSSNFTMWTNREPQSILNKTNEEFCTTITKSNGFLPLRYRYWIFDEYNTLLDQTIKEYYAGPDQAGVERFSVLSKGANDIKDNAAEFITQILKIRSDIESKISNCINEIEIKGEYVRCEEMGELNKDYLKRAKRVKDCEEIGPLSKEEWDRYFRLSLIGSEVSMDNHPWYIKVIEFIKEQFGWV